MSLQNIPPSVAKLVKPLIQRATEVQQLDPSISYFCKFHAADLILTQGLHKESAEVATLAMELLDDVESIKKEASPEVLEIINSKEAGYAHVEQFGVAVFNRAFLDVRDHHTTRATIDKFMASVVFLGLLKQWDAELADDIAMKLRFAKFHVARIARTLKAGGDPNDYEMEGEKREEEEDKETNLTTDTNVAESQQESKAEPEKTPEPKFAPEVSPPDLPSAPLDTDSTPKLPTAPRFIDGVESSLGLPKPPRFIENDANMGLPKAPRFIDDDFEVAPTAPVEPSETNTHPDKLGLPKTPTELKDAEGEKDAKESPKDHEVGEPEKKAKPELSPTPRTRQAPQPTKPAIASPPTIHPSKKDIEKMILDDEVISKAQKHAKFAISALNYEDAATAIKELEAALSLLKASS
ncbi:unnamed protein product [Kuraishia capsulata CBS 1993]|uniref:Vta1 C-terminal domain-containing protein n=1 Tax=Kuraishia capsulata CBS 1993 TaxID=1382522 RepID=W6MP64_9ASCO|nr:uncharacterized protein KUCA_T00002851001 [Kuraishia capsulata CBS 1993]CDK26877.1 unnamed protein product [Kuraishia capsulata CBS 1993]